MKKIALLFAFGVSAIVSNGQLTLTGSSYTQNFDAIGGGLPTGWNVYSGAGASFLGTISTCNTSTTEYPSVLRPDSSCIAGVVVGGFKNFPSANVCHENDDFCATVPPAYTDRALGVRQVSPTNSTHPNLDSGAAFVLQLANTTGMHNFHLSFKLQSLDTSSPRTTTWLVDYRIGSSGSFIVPTTTTGTWTTGGHSFSNNTCTVNFGTALDNISSNVYIRVVTLVYSSGSGNRASSAIDDYSLTYTNTTGINNLSSQPYFSFNVLGNATSDKVDFSFNVEESGVYNLCIYDMTGRILHSEIVNAQSGGQQISTNGLHLPTGLYFAKMSSANNSAVARINVQ